MRITSQVYLRDDLRAILNALALAATKQRRGAPLLEIAADAWIDGYITAIGTVAVAIGIEPATIQALAGGEHGTPNY